MANLNTIKNQVDFDKKAFYATEASLQINVDIQQYILLSIEYYKRYIELVRAANGDYATSKVTIEMPWCCDYTSFPDGKHTLDYKTYAINAIPMDNPEIYLPFQTSKLEFLKVLVFTSLKFNSYLYLDKKDLNEVNSNFIHSYLTQYFVGLRDEMLTAWANWRADAGKAYPVFHDTALNAYTKVDGCNCWDSTDWSAPHKNLVRWESTNYPDPRPNNNPKVIINGDKVFILAKPVTGTAFLVDAQTIVKNYMEARRYRLLEFAASLAAMEIQMASYLDDEDFAEYKNN